jgi:hypothetical protein
MLQLALAIATDAEVDRRYERAKREGDRAAINACRLELTHRRPLDGLIEVMKGN